MYLRETIPLKTCGEGYAEGMSAQEVSALMQIPLIQFNWLPNDIAGAAPRIEPFGHPHTDESGDVTCVLRMDYAKFFADILPPQEKHGSVRITCHEYKPISGLSSCWGEIDTPEGISAVSMFLHYPVEVAQKIANSIELINSE